jgi:tRNA(Ile2) C34 agmatinyltransferase TiaS
MIKLICLKCGATWYTANTKPNQKCSNCKARLREVDFIPTKENVLDKNQKHVTAENLIYLYK